jgi:hypothetical protein
MGGFFDRFLRYRFDAAALAFDAYATFFRAGKPLGRIYALIAGTAILGTPLYVLWVGEDAFGNEWAFGLALLAFAVVLEAPGHNWRRRLAASAAPRDTAGYDVFLFLAGLAASAAAPVLLLTVEHHDPHVRGILWGVAIAGAQDIARSCVATGLALLKGVPMYPANP